METVDTLPVCQAKSKQSGQGCKNYATRGKNVCRIHGGYSTGARTEAGRERQRKAKLKHGLRSNEAIKENREVRDLIRESKAAIAIR
jgi:hypothetical protein